MFPQKARILLICAAILAPSLRAPAAPPEGTLAFTVSMPQAANHQFHVALRCDGLRALPDFGFAVHIGFPQECSRFRVGRNR